MIITHVLQPLDGQTNILVGHEFNVQFTFENFGERDYEIYEISSEKNIKILDTSDDLITLPLNVPSGSQVSIKFNFTIEDREFLPLSIFISTTEQGRTDHVIRISEKVVEPIEKPTSELQIIGGVINLEKDLGAEEVLSSFITPSRACTDFSRPTNNGTIMCGNTTISRNGNTGKTEPSTISDMLPLIIRIN